MRGNKEVVIEGVCWACSVCDHMIATYTRARTDAERARARRGLVTCGQDCKVLSKHKGRYTDSLPVVCIACGGNAVRQMRVRDDGRLLGLCDRHADHVLRCHADAADEVVEG